jgi:hypothetical protein
MSRFLPWGAVLVVVGSMLLHAAAARDLEIDYGVGAGLEYSSNIDRSSDDGQNDVVGIGNVALSVDKRAGRVRINSDASMDYERFRNTFGNRTRFQLSLDSEGEVIRDRASWILQDFFQQAAIDSIDPQTPANRENINTFATGPDLFYFPSPKQRLSLRPRLIDFYYSDQDIDNRRYILLGSWEYLVSSDTSTGLIASAGHVNYDSNDIPNLDIENLALRFTQQRGRSELGVDLGGTWIQRDEVDNQSGFLGNVSWSVQINSRSSFQLAAFRRLGDSSSNTFIANSDPDFGGDLSGQQSSADTLTTTQAAATYSRTTASGYSGDLGISATDYDYEVTPQDRKEYRADAQVGRRLVAGLTGSLFGGYQYTDETSTGRTDKTYTLGLGFSYQLSRKLGANLTFQRQDRNSNESENEYDENLFLFSIIYGIGQIGPV